MIPPIISRKLASLIPGSIKAAVTLEFIINSEGTIIYDDINFGYSYSRTLIQNDFKLSYETADRILKGDHSV